MRQCFTYWKTIRSMTFTFTKDTKTHRYQNREWDVVLRNLLVGGLMSVGWPFEPLRETDMQRGEKRGGPSGRWEWARQVELRCSMPGCHPGPPPATPPLDPGLTGRKHSTATKPPHSRQALDRLDARYLELLVTERISQSENRLGPCVCGRYQRCDLGCVRALGI